MMRRTRYNLLVLFSLLGVFVALEVFLFHTDPSILTVTHAAGLQTRYLNVSKLRNHSVTMTDPRNKTKLIESKPISPNLTIPDRSDIKRLFRMLDSGGRFKPQNCCNTNRVAIIIPYRNRETQLRIFLQNMHPFLQRQNIEYGIYVVELVTDVTFNRGLLMNIGFVEALKYTDYHCFIFHDVDLLPEDDAILYTCPDMPRHMSVAVNTFDYKLPYPEIFGGVSALNKEHFRKVNGYSNFYFGWGGEDDDMYERINATGLSVSRYPEEIARYYMFNHTRDDHNQVNRHRRRLLKLNKRYKLDGLNTLRYQLLYTLEEGAYTKFLVHVDPADYNVKDYINPEPTNREVVNGMFIFILELVLVFYLCKRIATATGDFKSGINPSLAEV